MAVVLSDYSCLSKTNFEAETVTGDKGISELSPEVIAVLPAAELLQKEKTNRTKIHKDWITPK